MTTRTAKQPKPVKKPGKLEFKRGDRVAKRVIRENAEWLKEMAKK